MKFLHVTDLHWNPLGAIPQGRNEHFHGDCRAEFEALIEIATEQEVSAVVVSGDLFNLKAPTRYSPPDLLYYKALVDRMPCSVLTIPGNHDMPASSQENLNRAPYTLLAAASSQMTDLHGFEDPCLVTIPQGLNRSVSVYGAGYVTPDNIMEMAAELNARVAEGHPSQREINFNMAALHIDAYPDNTSLPPFVEGVSYSELLDAMPSVDVVLMGHIHHSFAPFTHQNATTGRPQMVSKPFSFGRVVRDYYASMEDIQARHKPAYAIVEFSFDNPGVKISYDFVPHRDFEECFNPDTLSQRLQSNLRVQSYFDALLAKGGSVDSFFTLESPELWLERRKAEIPPEVQTIIDEHLTIS